MSRRILNWWKTQITTSEFLTTEGTLHISNMAHFPSEFTWEVSFHFFFFVRVRVPEIWKFERKQWWDSSRSIYGQGKYVSGLLRPMEAVELELQKHMTKKQLRNETESSPPPFPQKEHKLAELDMSITIEDETVRPTRKGAHLCLCLDRIWLAKWLDCSAEDTEGTLFESN